jgi:hypothetical protein
MNLEKVKHNEDHVLELFGVHKQKYSCPPEGNLIAYSRAAGSVYIA